MVGDLAEADDSHEVADSLVEEEPEINERKGLKDRRGG